MDVFIQQTLNGVVLGSVYALIALGYTMVYGVLGIINFAHGDVLMVGAMVSLSVILFLQKLMPGMDPVSVLVCATLAAMVACMLLAFVIERVAYKPLRNAPRLAPLITAIAVSILLQVLSMMIWGRNPLSYESLIPSHTYIFAVGEGEVVVSSKELVTIVAAVVMMILLVLLVNKTRMGRAMRATAENPKVAGLMGVKPNTVISITFMLGAALAAIAGVMMATNYGVVHFYMGFLPGLKAFTAAVLGGIGNLTGAMVGGVLLGVIESWGAGYIGDLTGGVFGSNYQDVFAFIVLICVLVFRPQGIMGERVADRA
jgi:branched-chain amino acid transport system permease protein